MGLIGWMVFGLVVGALAKLVMPGKDPGGIVVTMLIGVVGGLAGGAIGRAMGLYRADEPVGFFMAFLGAVVLLWLYRLAVGGRSARTS
jgi:uncharacterized membrane protein YeaQ/YmgE (transglycosylase-associated protein family)